MSTEIREILNDKRILILGFGKEGQSTYTYLRSYFPDQKLAISDMNAQLESDHPELADDINLDLYCGEGYLKAGAHYDIVIKSPGIPYEKVLEYCQKEKITSQTDLFLRAYSERVIGVTGTKGKSTTSTLIHHMLKEAGKEVVLSGNIGIPPLSLTEEISSDTLIVFEMSSHQLEHISLAPATAVLLNIFPEHLDHYKDFTAYKMAKFNISSMQQKGGKLIYFAGDPYIKELMLLHQNENPTAGYSLDCGSEVAACISDRHVVVNSAGQELMIPIDEAMDLPGEHNLKNLMAAVLVCLDEGLSSEEIIQGIATYRRPEHRLEHAGIYGGITFINDSIATIPEACIEALRTVGQVDMLILGGHDRSLEYDPLCRWLREHPVPYLVFMGDAGIRMYAEWKDPLAERADFFLVKGMEEAFELIRKKLVTGDVCLLSPAAASYGLFSNFEERGCIYKKMAADLDRLPPLV